MSHTVKSLHTHIYTPTLINSKTSIEAYTGLAALTGSHVASVNAPGSFYTNLAKPGNNLI